LRYGVAELKPAQPQVGLALMPEADFLIASEPLFEAGAIEVLEWSFDLGWGGVTLPDSISDLLQEYSHRDRLLGHGVSYSLLSANRDSSHWLDCLAAECTEYHYHHISEHFGWMAAGRFDQSAPLPMPLLPETLAIGIDRLQQLAGVAKVPIGLENLAFAFGLPDVMQQGTFIDRLLAPIDGFLLLDLHNLYCQIHNFSLSAPELLARYRLDRVKEIHISGGSWSQHGARKIRRDTHDHAVPEAVFELLATVVNLCPQLEFIIFERIGNTLGDVSAQEQFRRDYYRINEIIHHTHVTRSDC
jgi:uncharacterized protein